MSDRSEHAGRMPPLPDPLPVEVVDNHCHLDIPGATRELAGEKTSAATVTDLLQRAAVEKVFQLARAPAGVHGTVRRLPVLVIIIFPFALEPFRITGAIPKLRFLQMNRLGAGIERPLHTDA